MNSFTLHLQSATQYECFPDAISFVAADDSGSFGIQAGHARMMASLTLGLARFSTVDGVQRYVAIPGALMYFRDNQLFVNTRRYLHGADASAISATWKHELEAEEARSREVHDRIVRLEDEILKRLWQWQKDTGGRL